MSVAVDLVEPLPFAVLVIGPPGEDDAVVDTARWIETAVAGTPGRRALDAGPLSPEVPR